MKETITWGDFAKVDLRVGTIVECEVFKEARKPAYKIKVDLGELGIKKSSAQVTFHYKPEELIGQQVICVCNFPEKQIGPIKSQVLITGFSDSQGEIILAGSKSMAPNGAKLH